VKVRSARFVVSAVRSADLPRDGRPQIVFAGRSNVGKSSLINRMLGRKDLARTSAKPGRTRTVNFFLIDESWYVVDLPGYGYARVSKREREAWGRSVDLYLRSAAGLATVVLLVDGKVAGTPLDSEAYAYLRSLEFDPVVAVTKIDRVKRGVRARTLAEVAELLGMPSGAALFPVSSRTGEGVARLLGTLLNPEFSPAGTRDAEDLRR
jgi:GTP-binding protein